MTKMAEENAVCYIESNTHIGKRFAWHDGGWRDPSEIGLGPGVSGFKTVHGHGLIVLENNDLGTRHRLREALADERSIRTCRVQGVSNLDVEKAIAVRDIEGIGKLYDLGHAGRSVDDFRDAKRGSLILDLDGLDMGYDTVRNDHYVAFHLIERLQSVGLDELANTSFLMQLSQSHGLFDTHSLRAHLEYVLDEPMTLEEQRQYAVYANAKFKAAGYETGPFDADVYQSNRPLFSHQSVLFEQINGVAVPRNGPDVEFVRRVDSLYDTLYIPDDVEIIESEYQGKTYVVGGNKEYAARFDPEIRDHNVDKGAMAQLTAAAIRSTVYDQEEAFEVACANIRAQIEALPQTQEKLRARLKKFDGKARRLWDTGRMLGTYTIARDWSATEEYKTIAEAREWLSETIGEVLEVILSWEDTQRSSVIKSPPPVYTIVAPAGVGKTTAFVSNVGKYVDDKKIWFSTGLTTTTREVHSKLTKEHGDSKVRHFVGRKQVCHPDMEDKCAAFEKIGKSPRDKVCPTCPHRATCPWPAQVIDNRTGVDMGQHAHITSTISAIKKLNSEKLADVFVLDESLIPTMSDNERVRKLKTLREITSKTYVYPIGSSKPNYGDTEDLVAYRDQIMSVISDLKDGERISLSRLGALIRYIDDYIAKERSVAAHYNVKIDTMADGDDFNPNAKAVLEIAKIRDCAYLFYDLARAIKMSRDAGRDYVFGVFTRDIDDERHVITAIMKEVPMALNNRGVINLDATASQDLRLEKNMWGDERAVRQREVKVKPEHYRLTQYADKQYSKSSFDTKVEGSVRHNVRTMALFIKRKAMKYKNVLVITTKRLRELLLEQHTFPEHVIFSLDDQPIYYGNIRGIDSFKHVDCGIFIGAMMLKVRDLEEQTEKLFANDTSVQGIERLEDGKPLPHVPTWRKMRDGTKVEVKHPTHPDPNVNAVLQQATWAECNQALNRLRIYDRTQKTRVDITVFGTWDTGLEIDELRKWHDEKDGVAVFARMCRKMGIFFEPMCPLNYKLFHNYLETFEIKAVRRAVDITAKTPDKWVRYIFHHEGRKHFLYADRSLNLEEDIIARRVRKNAGVDIGKLTLDKAWEKKAG